jgi:hypothetical protein
MYYGHLRGNSEMLFKQSDYGGVFHIAVDPSDALEAIKRNDQIAELRIDTYCGRNLKYGAYSVLKEANAGVRNACEFCFIEYEPEEKVERKAKSREDQRNQVHHDQLPF